MRCRINYRKSRVERDENESEFDIQNAETYMTLGTYILEETKSGTHEERRQYSEGTNRRSMGGYVTDHNTTRE